MADTATTRGRLRKQTLASNVNIWGDPYLNTNFDLLDQQIDGVTTIALGTSTGTTLTSTNYASDQQRNKVWVFTGTGTQTCTATVPQVEQVKLIVNQASGPVVIAPAAGTAVTVAAGERAWIYGDGTNFGRGDPTLDKVRAPTASVSLNSQRITSLADPSSLQDAATKNYVDLAMTSGAAGATFLTVSTNSILQNERVLTPATNELYLSTGTAGGAATIGLSTSTVALGTRVMTGGTFSGEASSMTAIPTVIATSRTVADWLSALRSGWVRVFPATTANGATVIYAPDGSVVTQSGSTTNGLQEAADYGRRYGYNVKAYPLNGAPLDAMFWYRGAWGTTTAYATQQVVAQSGTYYRCIVAHTSGTFATDLAAAKWEVFDYATLGTGIPTSWPTINGKQIYYRNTNYYMSGTLTIGGAQHMVFDFSEINIIYTGTGDAVVIDSGYNNTYSFRLIVATNATSALKIKPTTKEFYDGLVYDITALFHSRITVDNVSVDPTGTGVGIATDTTLGPITECVLTLGEIQAGIPLQLDGVNDIRGCRIAMERAYGPSVSGRYGIQIGTSSTNKKVYDNVMSLYAMPTAAGANGIQIYGYNNTIDFNLQDDEAGGALGTGIRLESTASSNIIRSARLEAGAALSDASGGANSVQIGNGLDGTVIGARVPAAGTFTTLTTTGAATVGGALTVNGNTTLGDASSDTVVITAKSVTAPNMPAFLATKSSSSSNVTGDGTLYTVVCDTEVYDRGSDYNSGTGVYTASVTGVHRFDVAVCLTGLTTGHTKVELILTTSNRTHVLAQLGGVAVADSGGVLLICGSRSVDMDAADTATLQVRVSNGSKVVGVFGQAASAIYTSFTGRLEC